MKSILDYISSHPMAVMGIAFLALLVVYFIFKQLLKLALVFLLIALGVGGYYYFKDPEKMPENMIKTFRETREKSGKLWDTGKKAYEKSKGIYEKGKEFSKEASELLKKKEEKSGRDAQPEAHN